MSDSETAAVRMPHVLYHLGFLAGQIGRLITISTFFVIAPATSEIYTLSLHDALPIFYPSLLREIYDPPIVLYVKGAWSDCLEQPCVAIVGSRRSSTYGQNAALMLSRDLAQRGVTIVSGFARGIDAAAHRGALEAGGRTIAVLGTGIDQFYPCDHKKLADEILERGGAVV